MALTGGSWIESPEIKASESYSRYGAVVGFVEESRSMNFYNSALVAVDGRVHFSKT